MLIGSVLLLGDTRADIDHEVHRTAKERYITMKIVAYFFFFIIPLCLVITKLLKMFDKGSLV